MFSFERWAHVFGFYLSPCARTPNNPISAASDLLSFHDCNAYDNLRRGGARKFTCRELRRTLLRLSVGGDSEMILTAYDAKDMAISSLGELSWFVWHEDSLGLWLPERQALEIGKPTPYW